MIKVTLEFEGVDQAIVALGKLVGAPASAPKKAATTVESTGPSAPAAPATPKRERKPRTDKGQPREPYGPRTPNAAPAEPVSDPKGPAGSASVAEPAAAPQTAAPASVPVPQAPAAQPPAATVPTDEQMTAALEATLEGLAKTMGQQNALAKCRTLIGEFGVQRWGQIAKDKRADFVRRCGELLAEHQKGAA